jgi:hypothetical protein
MNRGNYLHFIASFLIVLVFTIPFYTAGVYASIGKVTARGGDGIDGFAKPVDFFNINAQVSIPGDTISSNQVVLGSATQFSSCAASVNNGSDCSLRLPGNGTDTFEAKSVPFTVSLFRDDNTLDDTESGSITIDNKAPIIKLSSAAKFSSQQNVVIDYDATDFACDDPSCANKCVGIKSIEFFTSDDLFKQTINPAAGSCNVKSTIAIDPKTFNNGKNSVFAKAIDRFNQESPAASVTFDVDSSGPEIISGSFEILRKGIGISTFSSAGIIVDVLINISGNDINLNSVRADLSALNPSQNLKNAKASCFAAGDGISTCIWTIELNPGTGGIKNIAINVSDNSGNKESAAISKFLSLDDKGPVVLTLSTLSSVQGSSIAKSAGNTVVAVFDEATGLDADEVFLHVNERFKAKADTCSKQSSWMCIWKDVDFGIGGQIALESDTTDILGNTIVQDTYVGITVDSNAPVAKTINITPIGGLVQAFPGFAKIGDKISIVANVTEENDVFAVADFSNFVSGASKVAGQCEKIQADENVCTWLTDSINLAASGPIEFNFSDNAGNTLILTRSFKTFGIENATVPDFWTNIVACSPSTIDRALGPLISQKVYCQIVLRPKSASKAVSTVFIGPASCSGNGSSLVQNVDTFKTEVGSTSPVIKITLKKDDFKINNADLSCSFSIFSKIGSSTTITKNPEIENVKIPLAFFNNPLGELGKEVEGKIKQAKEDAEGIWEIIGVLNKIVYYAKKICNLIDTLYNIVSVLWTLVNVVTATEIAVEKTPAWAFGLFTVKPTAIASCGTQTGTRVTVQATNNVLNKFCSYVNCKQTILWGPAAQNYINSNFNIFTPGSYAGSKYELEDGGLLGFKTYAIDKETGKPKTIGSGKPISEYMDPNRNIVVAALFVCLPGIIYGLDKYRQILCLNADCMKNAVGKEGLPLSACEDMKSYQTCKYITTELFAVFPWTAVIDHFIRLIKNSLSNPLVAFGPLISFGCGYACPNPNPETRLSAWGLCETVRLFNQIGSIASDVKNIIDEGLTIRADYCQRLEDSKDKDKKAASASSTPTNATLKK